MSTRIRFDGPGGPKDILEVEGQRIPLGGEAVVSDDAALMLEGAKWVDVTIIPDRPAPKPSSKSAPLHQRRGF